MVVETNRPFGPPSVQANLAANAFTKAVVSAVKKGLEEAPVSLESSMPTKPRYRIVYRENAVISKLGESSGQISGSFMKNGQKVGSGVERTHSTHYKTIARVTMQLQELKENGYVTLKEWQDKFEHLTGSHSSVISGNGANTAGAGSGKGADLFSPPSLDGFLWKGFANIKIIKSAVDMKTETVKHTLQIQNSSPWNLKKITISLGFAEQGHERLSFRQNKTQDVNIPAGGEGTVSYERKFYHSVKSPKNARIDNVGLGFDIPQ